MRKDQVLSSRLLARPINVPGASGLGRRWYPLLMSVRRTITPSGGMESIIAVL